MSFLWIWYWLSDCAFMACHDPLQIKEMFKIVGETERRDRPGDRPNSHVNHSPTMSFIFTSGFVIKMFQLNFITWNWIRLALMYFFMVTRKAALHTLSNALFFLNCWSQGKHGRDLVDVAIVLFADNFEVQNMLYGTESFLKLYESQPALLWLYFLPVASVCCYWMRDDPQHDFTWVADVFVMRLIVRYCCTSFVDCLFSEVWLW